MAANPDADLLRALMSGAVVSPVEVTSNRLAEALGAYLVAADAGDRSVRLTFLPGDEFLQGAGVVQGGAVSAMLDFAMAWACFTALPPEHTVTTTSMTSNFMGAARGGEVVEAFGRVDRPGRRVMFTSAELRAGGKLIANATSSLLVLDLR